jgi:hypothetical protein
VFDQRIKRKQLPWTDNMFQDIEEFSKQLYYRFSSENLEAERAAIEKYENSKTDKQEEPEEEELSLEEESMSNSKEGSPLKGSKNE